MAPRSTSTFAATATDSLGISRVEFYQGVTRLGQDTTSPYTFAWNGVAAGNYLLSAVATDVQGLTTTSAVVSITVTSAPSDTLIASNSVWKYLDDGSDQGTGWTARNYDDSSWHSGPAQLGYGDGDEATTVSYGPNQQQVHHHLFPALVRRHQQGRLRSLNLWLLRDDGGVVYLNGTEIYRAPPCPAARSITRPWLRATAKTRWTRPRSAPACWSLAPT